MEESLTGIRGLFLDLDGTCYLTSQSGEITLVDGILEFLKRCEERGISYWFLSNNSSRSVAQYVTKLTSKGIPANADNVLLSTHDVIAWLVENGVEKVHLMGTEGCHSMFLDAGIETRSEEPQFVVIGYHNELTYADIASAAVCLQKGVPCIAIHGDMNCPSIDGGLPDVGSFLAMFETAIGTVPRKICGKPQPSMIEWKMREFGLQPEQVGIIGDRLYTDMEMAERAGVNGILVLSGEACKEDVETASQNPDLVVESVAALL